LRELNNIILHCSATEEGQNIGADIIRRWHIDGNGWSDIGYHFVIRIDGTIERGRDIEKVGAHVKGYNLDSIGICYIGGLRNGDPADTMSEAQELALLELVKAIRTLFGYMPITGHNEYAKKACPSFNVQSKYGFLNT